MSEIILQVDPADGAAVGEVDRIVAHRDGVWHASVHVWLLTAEGELVLQRRADHKELFPGCWDVSAAGHLRPGEDGLREVAEELGVAVSADRLTALGRHRVRQRSGSQRNNEWARVWLWRSAPGLDALSFPDGEVAAVAAVPVARLRALRAGATVQVRCWDGERLGEVGIASDELVPLPGSYWEAVLARV